MGRPPRTAEGGFVYHVLNRANGALKIFESDGDFAAFESVLREAVKRTSTRLLAYCVMPNHWHLVVWPSVHGELSRFVGWLTLTHTQRWHAYRGTTGLGHLYQGRFKSFPVQEDEHFFTVARYVERNPLRANLVQRAEEWRWCSLYRSLYLPKDETFLSPWPQARGTDWVEHVNAVQNEAELLALRTVVNRGTPFGNSTWSDATTRQLGLESTTRPRGRPKKVSGTFSNAEKGS